MNQESPLGRFLLFTAAFVIVVAGMKASESILVPFLLSLFIVVIFSPPLTWLKQRGVPSGLALVLVISLVVVIGLIFGAVVGSSIVDFRENLPEYQQRLSGLSQQAIGYLQRFGISVSQDQWQEVFDPGVVFSFVGNMLASLGNVMTNAFLILLTVIFILMEEVHFSDKVRYAQKDNAESTLRAMERFSSSINQYMAIKAVLSLLTGGLVLIWLLILGVDYPVLWGLLAFLLNFVPNLGSILAAIPAVLLALVQLGPLSALLTAAGYVAVNVGVGNVLEPRIMGRGLDLSTLVVFLSLVFWGWVLGPVGMLLSVPLTMTIKIALENLNATHWFAVLLSSGKDLKH
ncbi:MAG: AI-2E family transporter [Candidatus Pelagadaptatus aseana]|uniref:AI-2E family transporter n=1 Tax=Candidatus Pelagadaptatus aseana TaxID=3120508 RepID=UPI0039B1A2CE